MPSNYLGFNVNYQTMLGNSVSVGAGVQVKVFACTAPASQIQSGQDNGLSGSTITTLTTNADGNIVPGTLNVNPGTLVRFRVENFHGMAMIEAQVTT